MILLPSYMYILASFVASSLCTLHSFFSVVCAMLKVNWLKLLRELTFLVRTSGGVADKTPWEKYLKVKKQSRKEKRSKVKETPLKDGEERGGDDIIGFDDPFFQHDVTTATAVSLSSGNGSYPRYLMYTALSE